MSDSVLVIGGGIAAIKKFIINIFGSPSIDIMIDGSPSIDIMIDGSPTTDIIIKGVPIE